jgi:TonB family protein
MEATRCFALILPAFFAVATLAQTPAPATPETAARTTPTATPATASLPADPAALLQLAADANGLHANTLKPWHIRATWQTLDADKHVKQQGTWEEWWAGEKKFKVVITSGDASRTTWGTDGGIFEAKVVGTQPPADAPAAPPAPSGMSAAVFSVWPSDLPAADFRMRALLHYPVPAITPAALSHIRLQESPFQEGNLSLQCVIEAFVMPNGSFHQTYDAGGKPHPTIQRYCFDGNPPMVRIASAPGQVTTFNSLIRFQGQYLARNIRVVHTDLEEHSKNDNYIRNTTREYAPAQESDINIDTVEILDPVDDADFVPPPTAAKQSAVGMVGVASGVMAGRRISGSLPAYPADARHFLHSEGTVVLQAKILKDGTVGDLKVISGPLALQQAALDAVKTWRYTPYLLNGQPVEVETQVNVTFSMNH